jgi:hypothetical protein
VDGTKVAVRVHPIRFGMRIQGQGFETPRDSKGRLRKILAQLTHDISGMWLTLVLKITTALKYARTS